MKRVLFLFVLFVTGFYQHISAQTHHLYVAAESEDKVYQLAFNAGTGKGTVSAVIPVGEYPTETEGPHGITMGLEGDYWYLSVAHGNPYGWLYKYEAGSNKFVGRTELGMFPASMEISPSTGLLYVVNFNLHGDREPGTISIVDPAAMAVVSEIITGIMPHGSRITRDGKYQYHVSMMTDELMEVNTASMEVTRRLPVAAGDLSSSSSASKGFGTSEPLAKPTWADPHPTKRLVYVANNKSDEIVEVDAESWEVHRRFTTGKGPYNLEVSNDGKWVIASYKGEGATGVWNIQTGKEAARIANSRKVSHGVTISPDSRYAFISAEGIGGEPGSVDVIDLQKLERIEVIEVGKQAGGIAYWKTTD